MSFVAFLLALGAIVAVGHLRRRVAELEHELMALKSGPLIGTLETGAFERAAAEGPEPLPPVEDPTPAPTYAVPLEAPAPVIQPCEPTTAEMPPTPDAPPSDDEGQRRVNFEELFGRRLPVWGGAIALALAGFFLVKYSIEVGLVTPTVRCVLGLLFSIGLIGSAEAARRLPKLAADPRVAQALSGAGIATLYGTAYMATTLYALVTPTTGFIAMAMTTIAALGLSLRYGAPTALLGLLGGFATPVLVNTGEANVPALLGYLGLTIGGLLGVARAKGWRWLSLLALAGGFGWSGVLLASEFVMANGPGVGLFIILLALGGLLALGRDERSETAWGVVAFPLLSAVLAFIQLAVLVGQGGFGWSEWGLYGLLVAGVTLLALRDPDYVLLPSTALVIALVTLGLWPEPAIGDFAIVAGGALLLFAGPGYLLATRRAHGLVWAGQAVAATLALGALGYVRFAPELSDERWALLTLLLALPAALTAWRSHVQQQVADDPRRALLTATVAILAGAALLLCVPTLYQPVAFALLALAVATSARTFDDDWTPAATAASMLAALGVLLAVPHSADGLGRLVGLTTSTAPRYGLWSFLAPAILVAAVAWIERNLHARAAYTAGAVVLAAAAVAQFVAQDLRPAAFAIEALLLVEASRRKSSLPLRRPAFGVAGFALLWTLPKVGLVLGAGLVTLGGEPLLALDLPSSAREILGHLLLPGLMLGILARRAWKHDDRGLATYTLLAAAPVLTALAAFVAFKQMFGIDDMTAFIQRGFIERLVLTQLLFAGGACLHRYADRHELARIGAWALAALALARFVWFDLLVFNPLLQTQWVGSWPLLNLLTPAYGLPLLWIAQARRRDPTLAPTMSAGLKGLGLAAVIALVLLSVRQLFQGAILTGDGFATGEYYAYSLAGLLTAIGLLLWGAAREDQMTRLASLGLLLLTVAKVSLSDASALAGLWRIASFFGLGVSLIGISWFYTRRVFARRTAVSAG